MVATASYHRQNATSQLVVCRLAAALAAARSLAARRQLVPVVAAGGHDDAACGDAGAAGVRRRNQGCRQEADDGLQRECADLPHLMGVRGWWVVVGGSLLRQPLVLLLADLEPLRLLRQRDDLDHDSGPHGQHRPRQGGLCVPLPRPRPPPARLTLPAGPPCCRADEYINSDDCWMVSCRNPKLINKACNKAVNCCDDFRGPQLPDPKKFPHGIPPVVDYIHSKGLKAGLCEPPEQAVQLFELLCVNHADCAGGWPGRAQTPAPRRGPALGSRPHASSRRSMRSSGRSGRSTT